MNFKRTVHPELVKAYREAIYIVNTADDAISLKVGEVNSALASLMYANEITTAAVLTAYNPFSDVRTIEENEQSQSRLLNTLTQKCKSCINAIGTDAKGEWDPEPSIFALGISLQDAETLADEYGQNAFIWVNSADGFVSLRLRFEIGLPSTDDVVHWINGLPDALKKYAEQLSISEQSLIMSVPVKEQLHWLSPADWDLNQVWPLARPDGTAIGVGTELDRMFKLVAAGIQKIY
jgi:hypothetical protein